jgi:hypothetical protein
MIKLNVKNSLITLIGVSAGLAIPSQTRAISLSQEETSTVLGGAKQIIIGTSQNAESEAPIEVKQAQAAAATKKATITNFSVKTTGKSNANTSTANASTPAPVLTTTTTPTPVTPVVTAPPVDSTSSISVPVTTQPVETVPTPTTPVETKPANPKLSQGEIQNIVYSIAQEMGVGDAENLQAIDFIVSHESNWQPYISNSYSGAYGLFQLMSLAGSNADVQTQARAGIQYMISRYGSPKAAMDFWTSGNNWY